MNHLFPDYRYIGYDIEEEMLKIAREKNEGIEFYDKWEDIKVDFNKSLLNISSTIHEVYSYGTDEDIEVFWNNVFNSGFKYICIRDLMISENLTENVKDEDIETIRNYNPKSLKDYEDIWGSIKDKKNFVHYLLKYK